MPCTTILVGKKASNDHSTMIARTDDGNFDVKKLVVVTSDMQPRTYKSVLTKVEVALPDNPLRYTSCPNVDLSEGLWPATGMNEKNVGMTATETITSNPRVLAADPLVKYQPGKGTTKSDGDNGGTAKPGDIDEGREKPGGIDEGSEKAGGVGEEDYVALVLPYIRSAREGVLRLASLLETYGTCESNGIAFNDEQEVWWMETIGGHHWIARRVPDDGVVVNPNQFGMDSFDFEDAYGEQVNYMCSADLKTFMEEHFLDLNLEGENFNPRYAFGSRKDSDHIYNTPRAWFMGRYLAPRSYNWDGESAEFKPESDNIPWCLVPDKKVTVEDVKYLLSSYFQGTPYNPHSGLDPNRRGMYRPIGINRTGVTSICQVRSQVPDPIKCIEWICFGCNAYNALLPVYPCVDRMPAYLSQVTTDTSTENFYWGSRLIGALADAHYPNCIQHVERYQDAVVTKGRQLVLEYDKRMRKEKNYALAYEANEKLCQMARTYTIETLNKVLAEASKLMKTGYNRSDN